ncbi:hypothetical protein CPB86DRAFT_820794 [Serendipita vermifera]|nr:hypothetical protein CPB86DRAFT_820794 [Serendipita vermifera]
MAGTCPAWIDVSLDVPWYGKQNLQDITSLDSGFKVSFWVYKNNSEILEYDLKQDIGRTLGLSREGQSEKILLMGRLCLIDENKPNNWQPYEPLHELVAKISIFACYYLGEWSYKGKTLRFSEMAEVLNEAKDKEEWDKVERLCTLIADSLSNTVMIRQIASTWQSTPLEIINCINFYSYSRVIPLKLSQMRLQKNDTTTYGEMMSEFIDDFMSEVPHPCELVIDLGSGVGNLLLDIGMRLRPKEAVGIESRGELVELWEDYYAMHRYQCHQFGICPTRARQIHGNFTSDPQFRSLLKTANLVICNNFCFDKDLSDQHGTTNATKPINLSLGNEKISPSVKPIKKGFLSWSDGSSPDLSCYYLYSINMHRM